MDNFNQCGDFMDLNDFLDGETLTKEAHKVNELIYSILKSSFDHYEKEYNGKVAYYIVTSVLASLFAHSLVDAAEQDKEKFKEYADKWRDETLEKEHLFEQGEN